MPKLRPKGFPSVTKFFNFFTFAVHFCVGDGGDDKTGFYVGNVSDRPLRRWRDTDLLPCDKLSRRSPVNEGGKLRKPWQNWQQRRQFQLAISILTGVILGQTIGNNGKNRVFNHRRQDCHPFYLQRRMGGSLLQCLQQKAVFSR
ncbi:MAG: hypothetical protein LCI00_02560 [Chloroflexi bacterium]|nr:hypothetical protein [Chloroflexota bacterium]MCC6893525.1 hypothetical protein [Anaerolineae bacterium]